MASIEPKYITFDCYGTLTAFGMSAFTRKLVADRLPEDKIEDFLDDFEAFRGDEVLGSYKSYQDVLNDAFGRAAHLWGIEHSDADGKAIYDSVPSYGPHPDVPDALNALASKYPLVILSNASDSQIGSNVEKLGAPFHAVYTAQQAQAYKPRFQAFQYMLDQLGVGPSDVLHVSSSLRYDLIPAHDMRITNKVYLNRGYEPSTPFYGYHEVTDLGGVVKLLGI